jgi:uncharacterized membrane protein (UPF0182 family)
VETIYIQANEARMPQLKKVVLAVGDRLIYRDTFDQALAELTGAPAPATPAAEVASSSTLPAPANANNVPTIQERLHSLRDQAEQLTRALEKLEKEAGKK